MRTIKYFIFLFVVMSINSSANLFFLSSDYELAKSYGFREEDRSKKLEDIKQKFPEKNYEYAVAMDKFYCEDELNSKINKLSWSFVSASLESDYDKLKIIENEILTLPVHLVDYARAMCIIRLAYSVGLNSANNLRSNNLKEILKKEGLDGISFVYSDLSEWKKSSVAGYMSENSKEQRTATSKHKDTSSMEWIIAFYWKDTPITEDNVKLLKSQSQLLTKEIDNFCSQVSMSDRKKIPVAIVMQTFLLKMKERFNPPEKTP